MERMKRLHRISEPSGRSPFDYTVDGGRQSMLAVFVTRKIVGIDRHAVPVVREKSCVTTTAEKDVLCSVRDRGGSGNRRGECGIRRRSF